MVCVSQETKELSLNLKGPVVFNADNMKAIQCVLDRDDSPSNFPIKI
jgi:flagellar assembly factor FliW